MFDLNMLTTLEVAHAENPSLFPFPFGLHAGFAIFALVFFIFRFFTDKKPFQLIFAIAIPFSMTLWLSESRAWFYTVAAVEFVLIVCAFLSTIFYKKTSSEAEEAADNKEEADSAENESEEADASENDGE